MKKKIIAGLLAGMMIAGCGTAQGTGGGTRESQTEPGEHVSSGSEPGSSQETPVEISEESINVSETVSPIEVSYSESDLNEEWISALSGSSVNLFENILEGSGEGQNILISPTSMMMAFGMTENGAAGGTLSEMENVINGGISCQQMNPIMYAMAEHLESSEDVKWNVANSVWMRNDGLFEIVPEFAQAARSWYDADIWMAPFDEGTVRDINGWVSNETRGMINEIINGIDDENRMFLINAMAFEGEWEIEYSEDQIIENYSFTNYDGSTSNVTMLFSTEASYIELGDGIGFIRPYKGNQYSFVGILPDEGISVNDYITSLASGGADFSEAVRNPRYHDADIYVRMPEFTTEYEIQMRDVLTEMGMTTPFDPENADFSGIMRPVSDPEYNIWISSVLHKTFIDVNREGTRAAAVTSISLDTCMATPEYVEPLYITLDRPFVYAIVDNETGLPVFLGCVNSL
ncbi:MAG: serpin family protein [Lachnospiraceae bacterium]|nr:serpin family protein [Lachnospiraceae bacterium]